MVKTLQCFTDDTPDVSGFVFQQDVVGSSERELYVDGAEWINNVCTPRSEDYAHRVEQSSSSLARKLIYNRSNHSSMHVHGCREKGDINTSLESTILNGINWFSLAVSVIELGPCLRTVDAHSKAWLRAQIIAHSACAHDEGIDPEIISNRILPGQVSA